MNNFKPVLCNFNAPIHEGKVRDSYAIDADHMLIVASDRISAFDVVLPTLIPDKGIVLTQLSNFWFRYLASIVPNHLIDINPAEVLAKDQQALAHRSMVVKRLKPLPIEAIVRGYLAGSGWKDYRATGMLCGIRLPANLQLAQKLPQAIFTPSSKAAVGAHDENISLEKYTDLLGAELAEQVKQVSLRLYQEASEYALRRGIIIADTKFEFGLDEQGTLHLMDEVLTPDSSRFWSQAEYVVGQNPPSLDKQFVRDWLEATGWNKQAPAPALPADVVAHTRNRYQQALAILTTKTQQPLQN